MLGYPKQKPTSLQFYDYLVPSQNQLTPSTPNIINSFQDITPTNFKYNLDTPDKDDVGRAFSRHYKSIEERYQMGGNYTVQDNNNCFTLDLLNCDDEMHGEDDDNYIQRPPQANSACSSDIQSSSSSSGNKLSSSSYNESSSSFNNDPFKLTAKKRERNRLAAEKCRLKKQRKIKELENERRMRVDENSKLLERVTKQTEKLRSLQIFYDKLMIGEIKPQSCYH